MGYEFKGKTAVITGGSSGIGLETAKKLAAKGVHLWLLARRVDVLEEAKRIVSGCRLNPEQLVEVVSVDVADSEQISRVFVQISERSGEPDILINCAGITYPGYLETLKMEIIQEQMDINYIGTVNTIKAVLPGMLARGSGSIVNVSSMNGIICLPGYSAYSASKFAVRAISETLRAEVKRKGIHVAVIYPPDTDTPQHHFEIPLRPPEAAVLASLDKELKPEEVADEIIRAIDKKKFMVIPGLGNQFFYWFQSLTGTLAFPIFDLLLAWALNKANHKGPGA